LAQLDRLPQGTFHRWTCPTCLTCQTNGWLRARIVYRQLHLALFLLRRAPRPGRSWAERPLAMLLDLVRFAGSPGSAFADLGP